MVRDDGYDLWRERQRKHQRLPSAGAGVAWAMERIKSGSSDKRAAALLSVFVSDRRPLKGELLEYYLQKNVSIRGISMLILAEQTEDLSK